MHGPNGANYPNESVFREIKPDTKIVIEHVSQPRFTLTVTLTARGDKTHLDWIQEFESPEVAAQLRPLRTRQRAEPRPASVATREWTFLRPNQALQRTGGPYWLYQFRN